MKPHPLAPREIKRIYRPLSDADRKKYQRMREEIEADKPRINAIAQRLQREHDEALAELAQVVDRLREAREEQGLSLADVRDRSGLQRSAVCRLENDMGANPTLSTMMRFARAVGKRIVIKLIDDEDPLPSELPAPAKQAKPAKRTPKSKSISKK